MSFDYYKNELEALDTKVSIRVKMTDDKRSTKWLDLNQESIATLIKFLVKLQIELEKE